MAITTAVNSRVWMGATEYSGTVNSWTLNYDHEVFDDQVPVNSTLKTNLLGVSRWDLDMTGLFDPANMIQLPSDADASEVGVTLAPRGGYDNSPASLATAPRVRMGNTVRASAHWNRTMGGQMSVQLQAVGQEDFYVGGLYAVVSNSAVNWTGDDIAVTAGKYRLAAHVLAATETGTNGVLVVRSKVNNSYNTITAAGSLTPDVGHIVFSNEFTLSGNTILSVARSSATGRRLNMVLGVVEVL